MEDNHDRMEDHAGACKLVWSLEVFWARLTEDEGPTAAPDRPSIDSNAMFQEDSRATLLVRHVFASIWLQLLQHPHCFADSRTTL